jgi:beta-lactamase class A
MITRRRFVQTTCLAAFAGAASPACPAIAAGSFAEGLAADLAEIERGSSGRLGVAVLDTLSGAKAGHRLDERFPMCSTFKLLLAGAILAQVDAGRERLDRRIRIEARDVLAYAPITRQRAGADMSIAELCEAAITVSDNAAANLLLVALDGPAGLTRFARSLGDDVTRLDRIEPALNEALPGDPRDTTSPAAMLNDLQALVLGKVLAVTSRDQLRTWLIANKTGDARLRAGLPRGWRVGDKTGSGDNGTTNDVAIAWPPDQSPILIATYLTGSSRADMERDAILAAVARAVANGLQR